MLSALYWGESKPNFWFAPEPLDYPYSSITTGYVNLDCRVSTLLLEELKHGHALVLLFHDALRFADSNFRVDVPGYIPGHRHTQFHHDVHGNSPVKLVSPDGFEPSFLTREGKCPRPLDEGDANTSSIKQIGPAVPFPEHGSQADTLQYYWA